MDEQTWTARHDEAVLLVAEDALTDVAIAERIGISKRTLEDWKKRPLFHEKLEAVIAEIRAALMMRGIARLDRRVARLDETWKDLQSVIAQRAEELSGSCAGGDTGLIVMRQKPGPEFTTITEYVVDTGLLAELRALEMQAAKELGQWTEKRDVTTAGAALSTGPNLRNLSLERLKQLEEILGEAEDGKSSQPGECPL